MAKIKIKGFSELVDVSDIHAKMLKQSMLDRSVERDRKFDLGNVLVEKRDVVAVFLTEELNRKEDNQFARYVSNRNRILSLPLEERLKRQRKYFEFAGKLFGSTVEWPAVEGVTEQYLSEHPYRIWCDFRVWFNKDKEPRMLDSWEQQALRIPFIVENNERNEERYKLQELGLTIQ